ncbi:MAG: transposase [Candidatus Freyarchaeota archaeon]
MLRRAREVLNGEIHRLSRQLRRLARDDEDVRLLMTIPGVGYYLALLIKAEIGDIRRFRSGDHLCSYAGIVPSRARGAGSKVERCQKHLLNLV